MKEVLLTLAVIFAGINAITYYGPVTKKVSEIVERREEKKAFHIDEKTAMEMFDNDEEFRTQVLIRTWDIQHKELMRNVRYVASRDFKTEEDRKEAVHAQIKYLRRIDEMAVKGYYPNALIMVTNQLTTGPVPRSAPEEGNIDWPTRRVWWPDVMKEYKEATKDFGVAGVGNPLPDQSTL